MRQATVHRQQRQLTPDTSHKLNASRKEASVLTLREIHCPYCDFLVEKVFSDITGHKFTLLSRSDVALWGTALLAAAGIGAVESIQEAARASVSTGQVFTPDEAANKAYAPYIDLYAQATKELKSLYARLNKL